MQSGGVFTYPLESVSYVRCLDFVDQDRFSRNVLYLTDFLATFESNCVYYTFISCFGLFVQSFVKRPTTKTKCFVFNFIVSGKSHFISEHCFRLP